MAGNRLTTEEDNNQRMKEYFQNVFNCPEPEVIITWSDIPQGLILAIHTAQITVEEVKSIIRKLKNHRSPGEDLMSEEMLKLGF